MNDYQAIYEDRFVKNLSRYRGMRQRFKQRIEPSQRILTIGQNVLDVLLAA